MKKKPTVYTEKLKLDNALYNLTRYINFLENTFFVIFFVSLFIGALMILFGFLRDYYDLLHIGVLLFIISASVYVFIIKPAFLVVYAICKILVNTEKHTD